MPRQSDLFVPAHSPFGFPSTRAAPATACSRPAYCVFSSYRRVVCGGLRTNGKCGIAECGKNQNKPKLNLSVRAEERNKLEQMALFREPFALQSRRSYGRCTLEAIGRAAGRWRRGATVVGGTRCAP